MSNWYGIICIFSDKNPKFPPFHLIRVDQKSGFRVGYPKKPEPKVRVAGRVGLDLRIRVFSGQKPRKKSKIRVGSGLKNSFFFPTLVSIRTLRILNGVHSPHIYSGSISLFVAASHKKILLLFPLFPHPHIRMAKLPTDPLLIVKKCYSIPSPRKELKQSALSWIFWRCQRNKTR